MRMILEDEQRIRLRAGGEQLDIESADPAVHFSPLHMLAGSLATCTYAVLASWAEEGGHDLSELEIVLEWEYAEDPYRVGRFELEIEWPGLDPERRRAALRVAEHCTVEHTLRQSPMIKMRIGG